VECKSADFRHTACEKQELIETLWNVNKKVIELLNNIKGINRNIVECKL
jgi:hypothetical protein